jgi:RHS repeat-associated protein
VRVIFIKKTNGNAVATQETHYYAHGLQQAGIGFDSSTNEYFYNGKELQEEAGLQYLNYGWRQLDPQLGIWHSPDKLAEMYPSMSPYCYGGNNPINNIDIAGLTIEDTFDDGNNTGGGCGPNPGFSDDTWAMISAAWDRTPENGWSEYRSGEGWTSGEGNYSGNNAPDLSAYGYHGGGSEASGRNGGFSRLISRLSSITFNLFGTSNLLQFGIDDTPLDEVEVFGKRKWWFKLRDWFLRERKLNEPWEEMLWGPSNTSDNPYCPPTELPNFIHGPYDNNWDDLLYQGRKIDCDLQYNGPPKPIRVLCSLLPPITIANTIKTWRTGTDMYDNEVTVANAMVMTADAVIGLFSLGGAFSPIRQAFIDNFFNTYNITTTVSPDIFGFNFGPKVPKP